MEKALFKKYVYQYIKVLALYLNGQEAHDLIIDDKALSFFFKLLVWKIEKIFLKMKLKFNLKTMLVSSYTCPV